MNLSVYSSKEVSEGTGDKICYTSGGNDADGSLVLTSNQLYTSSTIDISKHQDIRVVDTFEKQGNGSDGTFQEQGKRNADSFVQDDNRTGSACNQNSKNDAVGNFEQLGNNAESTYENRHSVVIGTADQPDQ